ncbi:hypothetical protein AB6A40_008566 [Gnathostoma spinigerum]|uniref:Uncharacterized protein n=1 Tax=Gnathostoma spinigerum TaxID=75299 RepID=A0ABD6EYS7_9BILA
MMHRGDWLLASNFLSLLFPFILDDIDDILDDIGYDRQVFKYSSICFQFESIVAILIKVTDHSQPARLTRLSRTILPNVYFQLIILPSLSRFTPHSSKVIRLSCEDLRYCCRLDDGNIIDISTDNNDNC